MKIDKIEDVTKENIIARASDLSKFVLRTPTIQLSSERLKTYLSGAEIYLKLECMQHTGTFKARGAISVALQIPTEEVKFGITAASAGNHAIASSWAARQIDTTKSKININIDSNELEKEIENFQTDFMHIARERDPREYMRKYKKLIDSGRWDETQCGGKLT